MSTKAEINWKEFEPKVKQLAYRYKHKIGMSVEDTIQELWVRFFSLIQETPGITKANIIVELEKTLRTIKKDSGNQIRTRLRLKKELKEVVLGSEYRKHWSVLSSLWDQYVENLNHEDRQIIKLHSRNCTQNEIARKLGIDQATVGRKIKSLIDSFKEDANVISTCEALNRAKTVGEPKETGN